MGSYDTTIGTLLVGIFFNTFLYGLATCQFAAYHLTKFNDPPMTRSMVLFLFILDTFYSASLIYLVWDIAVTGYDSPAALPVTKWPLSLTPLASALSAVVTQIYLGFRIWRLTSSKFLYGVVILLAIPSFILAIITSANILIIRIPSGPPRRDLTGTPWLSMQVIVDTFITVVLVVVFSRSRTGLRKTDTILNRFIRSAIQTGVFTGLFSLGNLISHAFWPYTFLNLMFTVPLGRIYTNTLMDTLLARELLMEGTPDSAGTTGQSIQVNTVFCTPTDSQAIPMV